MLDTIIEPVTLNMIDIYVFALATSTLSKYFTLFGLDSTF